ncbi:MAG: hypothetical protein ACXADW_09175 [Candidatus Hodarchaeales archaeon]|jgi:hypothetical protein
MEKEIKYKLSNQAVGAIMLALQKGILEQTDITYMLKEFEILNSVDGLIVNNPPTVSLQEENKKELKAPKKRKKRTTKKKTTARKIKEDA